MKILIWTSHYYPSIGGLEKMLHTLVLALRQRGHQILIISGANRIEELSFEGIPVFRFPLVSALHNCRLPLIQQILKRISELVDHFSPDVLNVHAFTETLSFYQVRILENHFIPTCITAHGFLDQDHYNTKFCSQLWQKAQAVSVVSQAIIPPEPHPFLQIIYNGLPPFKAAMQPLPQNRLLMVGRLSKEKGFDTAFHSLKILLAQHPDLRLTLVGDGPDYQMLWQLKQSLGLPIDMPGLIHPDLIQNFIDQATIVLVPSRYEAFSLVSLEAALRKRPVVASRILGLKEVIEDQKTGLLVDPQTPLAFADAIHTLLSNPQKMEEMGQAAFERASRLFTIDATVSQYLTMYEQTIQRSQSGQQKICDTAPNNLQFFVQKPT